MLDTRLAALDGEFLQVDGALGYVEYLRGRAGAQRVEHSISVARLLYVLAWDLNLNAAHAVAAGLLHDSCKGLKDAVLLEMAKRYEIAIGPVQKAKPSLLHGPVAAEICRTDLGIDRAEIYDAIYWHVTGRPGLSRLGQALFFADFSEPLRRHPLSEEARKVYDERGFAEALRFAAQGKLTYLAKKGAAIDPQTQAFYDWLTAERRS